MMKLVFLQLSLYTASHITDLTEYALIIVTVSFSCYITDKKNIFIVNKIKMKNQVYHSHYKLVKIKSKWLLHLLFL